MVNLAFWNRASQWPGSPQIAEASCSSEPQGTCCLCLPSADIASHHAQFLIWVLGFNQGLPAGIASILPMMLSPQPFPSIPSPSSFHPSLLPLLLLFPLLHLFLFQDQEANKVLHALSLDWAWANDCSGQRLSTWHTLAMLLSRWLCVRTCSAQTTRDGTNRMETHGDGWKFSGADFKRNTGA